MSCTKYDDFELGRMSAAEMTQHLETCAECRRQAALDKRLTQETARLREPLDDAGLWGRIESGLAAEAGLIPGEVKSLIKQRKAPGPADQTKTSDSGPGPSRFRRLLSKLTFTSGPPTFARTAGVAAAALVILGLAAWFLVIRPSPSGAGSGLMADAALARVENEEREYAAAIEELEAKASPKLAQMDFSLMALYRDRLETIDAQIERCREAIAQNPWNAHIRRYMLAALHDKKDTLGQILSQQ